MNAVSTIPEDVLRFTVEFALSRISDLRTLSTISRSYLKLAACVLQDGNALLCESEFKHLDPVLHACMTDVVDQRSPWRIRLSARLENAKTTVASLMPSSPVLLPRSETFVEVVLYNHPTTGYMLYLGEVFKKFVVVYGFRTTPESIAVNSSKVHLSQFGLPAFAQGAPLPNGPSRTNLLILVSVNGAAVSDFADFESMVDAIHNTGEFCCWRFLHQPTANFENLPIECCFATHL
jgi:hypothetical protein